MKKRLRTVKTGSIGAALCQCCEVIFASEELTKVGKLRLCLNCEEGLNGEIAVLDKAFRREVA